MRQSVQGHQRHAARPGAGDRARPGSGKSTTLAAMIDYKNDNRVPHILTIEDPIEFVHDSKKCLINQREVHRDTLGFSRGAALAPCARTRTSSWSARCVTSRPSAWR
jgi:hypothetical protein